MLISLRKNMWMYLWLKEKYKEEFYEIIFPVNAANARPEIMNKKLAEFLASRGYKSRCTSRGDIILAISEEEYIFLKLKYD